MVPRGGLNGHGPLAGNPPKRLEVPLTVLGALAVLVLFFGPAIFGEILYSGDAARVYLPERLVLMQALSEGTLPWWTTDVGAGYPLLAEGQVAAFYPISLLLALVPADISLNLYVFVHLALAAAGWVFFARTSGRTWAGAALGALVYTLGGFNIAHLSHLPVLATAAWAPWQFGFTRRILGAERLAWRDVAALAVVTGLQWLAGHVQVAVLGMLPLLAYALWLRWPRREAVEHPWRRSTWWVVALGAGLVLASPQLLPSIELVALSQRAGGLDPEFFTSFSFYPLLTATYLAPFLRGNPYPEGSVELMCYVGLLPLGLAAWALWRERRSERWFWAILALVGLLLAFGRWNPLYDYLRRIPVLNLFRVPSRYLYWTSLSLAVLGGMGLDALAAQAPQRFRRTGAVLLGAAFVGLSAALGAGMIGRDVDGLVAAWQWLPMALGAVTLMVLAAARFVPARIWQVAALVLLVADLYAYNAVLSGTYNGTTPREQVLQQPALLEFLKQDGGLQRIYTKEEIMPVFAVQRESLFPNIGLQHGLDSANLYLPLAPDNYRRYVEDLTASRLDRLNVRYYLIPQLLPVDEESELYDVYNPLTALPYGEWLRVPPQDVVEVEVESYLSHSVGLADGTLATEIVLRDGEGREEVFPLRVGLETAEWAYSREDVREQIVHSLPEIAYTFPARSGFPARPHEGYVYRATLRLETPMHVREVLVRNAMPEAFVRIEGVKLIDPEGGFGWLEHLIGLGRHRIVYRSEDVLVYRNEDMLPRTYTIPAEDVSITGLDLWLPEGPLQDRVGAVEVLQYESTRVRLQATVDAESYLILADLHYPGWEATVDGQTAELLAAEGVFRAVRLAPGTHEVIFSYHPAMTRGLLAVMKLLH